MAESIFTNWLENVKPNAASEYCAQYPHLALSEAWRWTPLASVFDVQRYDEMAGYQFDFPESVDLSDTEDLWQNFLQAHKDAPFAALNLALCDDTLTIRIPSTVECEQPLILNVDAIGKKWQFSRVAITVGTGAKAAFWLDMAVERDSGQLPLVKVTVEDNAEFDMVLWLGARDLSHTAQLAYIALEQYNNTQVRVNAMESGGALARVDVQAEIKGEGANFSFGGVQTLSAEQVGDYHINVRHLTESCESQQVVRGVLKEKSQGIFDGLIYVAHGAQKTDAKQDSRYILLSNEAKSHSVPRLEIYADDVQCAHGSTVGFLDPESLFYLQSRGIDSETAKTLLITSFLHEAVFVEHEALKTYLQSAINQSWMGEQ